ncbi:MAG: ABC transporter ATP-binding protein [Candidatus Riflebacteria bacterium HGW-Riflebacteria-1]|jgi:ABC-2 type transport system ATP-binding protein|nr:MAG: ABC transporter ATP-binding protein [Candidatus Riflebacteria bacterium HGW-Riflebacteria-1]
MIAVESLAKSFGSIRAVDSISFTVNKGEILGFLGPNGAGKSTTMKMITTFLPPTSGSAKVANFDIWENPLEVRARIGYLPESAPSYKDMNVYDFLMFTAEVRGYDGEERKNRVVRMLETCNLKDVAWQLIDTLSKGYRQRVGFAQALLHDPEYLVLDEPTDGLDPNQKQEVRALIRRMGREKCIILSTHILEEVEAVCSRAIIIGNGKIVADGTPEALRRRSKLHGAVTLELFGADLKDAFADLEKIAGVERVELLTDEDRPSQNARTGKNGKESENGMEKSVNDSKEAEDSKAGKYGDGSDKTGKSSLRVRLFPKKGVAIAHEAAQFVHQRKWEVDAFTLEKGDLNEVFYNLTRGGQA